MCEDQTTAPVQYIFAARDPVHGGASDLEPWVTDGTAEGTHLLLDIVPGTGGSSPSGFTALGDGRAVFTTRDGTDWITDGTAEGTTPLPATLPALTGGSVAALGDGRFLLALDDGMHGTEPVITDFTAAGTRLLADLNPGPDGSAPALFTALGDGRFVFSASDRSPASAPPAGGEGEGVGRELWISDGTAGGTHLLADINPGAASSDPGGITLLGDGRFLFTADDGTHGEEPWISDGTACGTHLLADIQAGAGRSTFGSGFTALGDGRFIVTADDGIHGLEPWITDGTACGTHLLADINPGLLDGVRILTSYLVLEDGRVLMTGDDGIHGLEPWITDGTAEGTRLLADIQAGGADGASVFASAFYTALGDGRALFAASDGLHGREPWVTDGTTGGTQLVMDIHPGEVGSDTLIVGPLAEGRVLLRADDGEHGIELWSTDGTAEGTALVKDIWPGSFSSMALFFTRLTPMDTDAWGA
ncbi:hypothetical protein [Roseicella frigidaeris]|nr:hypothetical protein [Roseicella frigidaeris]